MKLKRIIDIRKDRYFLWHKLTIVLAIWFVAIDTVRKFFNGSKLFLVFSDVFVLFVFLIFFLHRKTKLVKILPRNDKLFLTMLVFYLILSFFYSSSDSLLVKIAGLRLYLFFNFSIFLGYYWMSNMNAYNGIKVLLYVLSILATGLAAVQYFLGYENLPFFLQALEHSEHSFGTSYFSLISSFFASSKRYGRFLIVCYSFVFGINLAKKTSIIQHIITFAIFFSGTIMSGAREASAAILIYHIVHWILSSKKGELRVLKVYFLVFGALYVFSTLLDYETRGLRDEDRGMKHMVANKSEWSGRTESYLIDSFRNFSVHKSIWNLLFGKGVGTFGGMATSSFKLNVEKEDLSNTGHDMKVYSGDAGISKIILELGLIGTAIFITFYSSLILNLFKKLLVTSHFDEYPLLVSIFSFVIVWLILFFKAHTVLSDSMMSFAFWFYIGIFYSVYRQTQYRSINYEK